MLLIVDRETFIPVARVNDIHEAKDKIQELKKRNPNKEYYVKDSN